MTIKKKTKIKAKSRTKAAPRARTKPRTKTAKPVSKRIATPARTVQSAKKPARKPVAPPVARAVVPARPRPAMNLMLETMPRPTPRPVLRAKAKMKVRPHRASSLTAEERRVLRNLRLTQFNYMRAPGLEYAFEVGDTVEVFCDHEKNNERVRGWIKGIVVQVDNKMVAVQFRSNVFLTDGWMVPDRILWYPLASDQIRQATIAKKGNRKDIPDY
jgi:hypothetical protein